MSAFWKFVIVWAVLLVIAALAMVCIKWPWVTWIVLPLVVLFIYNGLKKIPAKPPNKAILVFLGKRLKVVLTEGWKFFPIHPFLFDFILIKVEKVNYDLEPQQVRTPDRAMISIQASITWTPGIEDSPESYIAYLNSGGEEGVKKIIHDIIEDRTKTWAGSNREGPSTWMEAQAMKDDAHLVLAKSILGDALTSIPKEFQGVPTSTWMRFLDQPQSEPTEYDANPRNGWASRGIDAAGRPTWDWNGLQTKFSGYSPIDQNELKDAVKARRDDTRKIREGKANFGDESLGITIVRFTINDLKVEGEVARAAELEEKERRERDADAMELDNVSARVQKFRKENPDATLEEAIRTVQIERGKISKSVIEVLGASTGIGQDVLGALGFQKTPNARQNPTGNPSGGNPAGGQGGGGNLPPPPPGMI